MKVNILGTEYEIIMDALKEEYPKLNKCSGYTDFSIKQIVISKLERDEMTITDLEWFRRKVLRHELIHAFLYESGLAENSDYAENEEMVDWIAMQFEKMLKVFEKVNAIEHNHITINNDTNKTISAKAIVDEIGKVAEESLESISKKAIGSK